MKEIIVDAYGGDNAPFEIVKGTIEFLNKHNNFNIVLVGNENELNTVLSKFSYQKDRLRIIDAREIISNNESPTTAIRTKKNSSIVKAFDELRLNDNCVGFVSAGSTGAVLTGAFLKLGRIKGISRPATCPILPTLNGGSVAIIDSGANVDCKPINLVHFALMANAYMKYVYGVKNPRIALLNVGVEDHKGNELTHQTFEMLKSIKDINFVGNMEARDLFSGDVDVVVCDGFNGNVLLKSSEGAVKFVLKSLKSGVQKSFFSKLGALFMGKTFKTLKQKLDYSSYGGAVMLGTKKVVVKCHGSSLSESIYVAIVQVAQASNANVCDVIENNVSKYGEINE